MKIQKRSDMKKQPGSVLRSVDLRGASRQTQFFVLKKKNGFTQDPRIFEVCA